MEILLHALDRLLDLAIHVYHKAVPSKAELEALDNSARTQDAYYRAVQASAEIAIERRKIARHELAQALRRLDIEADGAVDGVESAKATVASIGTRCEQNIDQIRFWQVGQLRAARRQLRAVSDQLSIVNENVLECGSTLQRSARACTGAAVILNDALTASVADAGSQCEEGETSVCGRAEAVNQGAAAASDRDREACT